MYSAGQESAKGPMCCPVLREFTPHCRILLQNLSFNFKVFVALVQREQQKYWVQTSTVVFRKPATVYLRDVIFFCTHLLRPLGLWFHAWNFFWDAIEFSTSTTEFILLQQVILWLVFFLPVLAGPASSCLLGCSFPMMVLAGLHGTVPWNQATAGDQGWAYSWE